jgi:hypothetical protein
MSENKDGSLRDPGPHRHAPAGSPTTQQMRSVGERRRAAEEKLEHHLQEARHKDDPPTMTPPGRRRVVRKTLGWSKAGTLLPSRMMTGLPQLNAWI